MIIFLSNIPTSFAIITFGGLGDAGDDFIAIAEFPAASGNIDWLFFSDTGGGVQENNGIDLPFEPATNVDFDDSNGMSKSTSVESFATCIDDIRRFYDGSFGTGVVDDIFLFLDISEGGSVKELDLLRVEVRSFGTITSGSFVNADDPCSNGDVSTSDQDSIGDPDSLTFSSVTLLASLSAAAIDIPQIGSGGAKADWAISTGIDPDDGSLDGKNILVSIEFDNIDDGFEEIFLSGSFVPGQPVGGKLLPLDTTALLLAGVQSISMWMIPVIVFGVGIGIFMIKRKK